MFFKIYNFPSLVLLLLSILNYNVYESEAIVNGEKAQPGEFPSIVSLRNETGRHYCGGTLVTRKHVVTAGHCLFEDDAVFNGQNPPLMLKPENIKVVAGTLSRVEGGETYEVEKFIVHPDYNIASENFLKNNVAVIVLKQEINKENITPTPISTTVPKEGASGKVGGWGVLSLKGYDFINQNDFPTDLQKLSVVIKDKATCKNKFKEIKLAIQQIDTEFVICAQSDVKDSGLCTRDNGSPLLINGEFVGYVVGGYPCATGRPDFFAPTATYRDFINGVINAQAR